MPSLLPSCLAALALCLSTNLLQAQQAPANPSSGAPDRAVLVKDIRFSQTRMNGMATNAWNRVEVVLDARSNPDPKSLNKRWVDRVKVTVTLGFNNKNSPKNLEEWSFYRASATVLTMEVNSARSVFFYLPGDIVKRDSLRKDPDVHMVELEVAGTPQALFDDRGAFVTEQKASVSKLLADKAAFDNVKGFADRGSLGNAGFLRPHYLVDNLEQDVARFSPEFVREDLSSR
jgi:hypothetical protein